MNKLKDICVTHISLVKAGANGKTLIYKSAETDPIWCKEIKLRKCEKGMIYGIVYSPDEVDSQGDMTDASQIEKAAYAFMKNRQTTNVDQEHDFINTDAFVAESWLVRPNDPIFSNEKEGSWAVGIKLESDELIKAVKKGEIAGISMAGSATREEIIKEDKSTLSALLEALKKLSLHLTQEKEKDMTKEQATQLEKSTAELLKTIESLKAVNEELLKTNEDLNSRVQSVEEELKKSKQDHLPKSENQNLYGGIL